MRWFPNNRLHHSVERSNKLTPKAMSYTFSERYDRTAARNSPVTIASASHRELALTSVRAVSISLIVHITYGIQGHRSNPESTVHSSVGGSYHDKGKYTSQTLRGQTVRDAQKPYMRYRVCARCTDTVRRVHLLYPPYKCGTPRTQPVRGARAMYGMHGRCTPCIGLSGRAYSPNWVSAALSLPNSRRTNARDSAYQPCSPT